MLIKDDGVWETIEEIKYDDVGELESLRNCYNMRKECGCKWKVEIIDMKGIEQNDNRNNRIMYRIYICII